MLSILRSVVVSSFVFSAIGPCTGCGKDTAPTPTAQKPPGRPAASATSATDPAAPADDKSTDMVAQIPSDAKTPAPVETPRPEVGTIQKIPRSQNLVAGNLPPSVPKIFMSEGHEKSVLVKVGQPFPVLPLTDAAGKNVEFKSVAGKFTIVVFWSAKEPSALEELKDLQTRVLEPYKNVGVRVVAINALDGETPETKAWLEKAALSFPTLNDAEGKYLAAVGRGQLPRTFLIDENGKVLWLDIEYSRTTRRHLVENALPAVLKEI